MMNITITEKKCGHCKIVKSTDDFYVDKKEVSGYRSFCKICCKEARHNTYLRHKKSQNASTSLYYKQNSKKMNEYKKDYIKKNPERYKQWNKKWYDKRASDPFWKINHCISGGINKSLKGKKNGRHWEDLVGYSVTELIHHLESKFKPGMTWDNYGEWHVDHIKPKSMFKYINSDDQEFIECWSLNNLQPLWAIDNYKKSFHYIINTRPT